MKQVETVPRRPGKPRRARSSAARRVAVRGPDRAVTPTLATAICQELEQEIAAGRLAPGARLDEQEIAERFGASRTPVREAFRLLASSGLVELRGRQGVAVRSIGAHALIEMFQVMAELEGLCARLASRRITPAALAELERIHARLVTASHAADVDAFYDVNQEFHEAIYDAAHNAFLADQTRRLRNQVAAYRRRVTRMPNRVADTLTEHAVIVDAIRCHDPDRAQAAMRSHVGLLGDDLIDFLATFS